MLLLLDTSRGHPLGLGADACQEASVGTVGSGCLPSVGHAVHDREADLANFIGDGTLRSAPDTGPWRCRGIDRVAGTASYSSGDAGRCWLERRLG